ncbi:apolipoprotein N-acyltransferase [Caldimonas brevitalea]|uniref:Apolipoprotein N-acyltransferase n=1 Tax=Caldimonas brevitalea TaxID=413882 RepID=A0A0G3BYQ5_9BURK|nr:apolipoprotein N-acyltransferase [Caldimonas brevitalea]
MAHLTASSLSRDGTASAGVGALALMHRWPALLLCAAIAGAVSPFGWAPVSCWPVALLGYGVLFSLLPHSRSPCHAFAVGLAFGLGLHLSGHGWVYTSLHDKTGMSVGWAVLGSAIFIGYLAIFTAVPCAVWRWGVGHRRRYTPSGQAAARIVAFSVCIALGEYARSLPFGGFTSLSLGHAMVDTWLAPVAPVLGVYGLSTLALAASAAAVTAATGRAPMHVRLTCLAATAVLLAGGRLLEPVEWVRPLGAPLSFRLIQGNVSQERKFDPQHVRAEVEAYLQDVMEAPADIVATPETAFPLFLNELPADTLSRLQDHARATGSHVFLGVATLGPDGEGRNSVVQVTPHGELSRYDKVRLMPFGEYSPIGLGWFAGRMQIALKDLQPGAADQPTLQVRGQRLGVLICHEDLFGEDTRRWVRRKGDDGVTVLLNVSNLAWFDGSDAIDQRLQIVRLHALALARPVLRVANTGVTVLVDARGRVGTALPTGVHGILSGQVQGVQGLTPYARYGEWPFLALSVSALGLAALLAMRTARH